MPAPSAGIGDSEIGDEDSTHSENGPVSSCSYEETRTVYVPASTSEISQYAMPYEYAPEATTIVSLLNLALSVQRKNRATYSYTRSPLPHSSFTFQAMSFAPCSSSRRVDFLAPAVPFVG